MARTGLYKSDVKQARDLLLSQGRHPSADAVRIALGNTGSKTTIHRYLKELESDDGSTTDRQNDTARELQDFIEQLAKKLHAEADERINELCAKYETALRQKDAQLKYLQTRADGLLLKLQEMEFGTRHFILGLNADMEAAQRQSYNPIGFDLLANNFFINHRNGDQAETPFGGVFSTRRS